jgi:hypothetical protein
MQDRIEDRAVATRFYDRTSRKPRASRLWLPEAKSADPSRMTADRHDDGRLVPVRRSTVIGEVRVAQYWARPRAAGLPRSACARRWRDVEAQIESTKKPSQRREEGSGQKPERKTRRRN